ncbi:hypothetical protein IZ6_11450 [Terrihabitans soli]|uniref:diguanylate cyclase n=1 Tax=Terrihabitans soli TaxID=708113 RepID=A0A6S6QTY3_9HYPH|nr:sensor domain-containing diguanylate cyclase [Terrihabitans soli]BCJ90410.1 hypothetical protein IZ6_11450 [Terrihabitans soli]
MAAFFAQQMDFIFFFYGLAFVLLGASCWAFGTRGHGGRFWLAIAAFGFLHGALEWLDLTALIIDDSPLFASARTVLMLASYLALLEAARSYAVENGARAPPQWAVLLPVIPIALIGYFEGSVLAGIATRYSVGFMGNLAVALVLLRQRRQTKGLERIFFTAAVTGFVLYAMATGLVVPAAGIWPADILNYDSFAGVSGIPIQLVRGVIACWISFSVWGIWGQRAAEQLESPQYTRYVAQQFTATLVAMTMILGCGWVLTQYLGEIYKRNVERAARGDTELISGRLGSEIARTEGMVDLLARSSAIAGGSLGAARDVLQRHVRAADASAGYLLDPSRSIRLAVTASGLALPPGQPGPPAATGGMVVFNGAARRLEYHVERVLPDGGSVVLQRALSSLESDLNRFDGTYFIADAQGTVLSSNRSDLRLRQLWPSSKSDAGSIFPQIIMGGAWTKLAGERVFAYQEATNIDNLSLVIVEPSREIFATRLLGIVITFFASLTALVYILGRERVVRDAVQAEKRLSLQATAQELRVKATTDPLTGLRNRRQFNQALGEEILRANRENTPLSLGIYDIDHFKAVNDRYGHAAGDEVLVQLARRVREQVRESDLLARWGGEEFVILLPGASIARAAEIAENIRKSIADAPVRGGIFVTASFGVAQYRPGETATQFLENADLALYRSKSEGRNRVTVGENGQSSSSAA